MKNFWAILSVVIVIVILLLSSVLYQVRQTETVIIKRFGKVIRTVKDPGLQIKFPVPIDVVVRYDSRNRLFDAIPEEQTQTAGGEPIIVKSYTVWSIADPDKFLTSVKDLESAEDSLKSLIRSTQKSVIGNHAFSEFVNTDPEAIQFKQIEDEITSAIRDKAMQDYGIAIKTVGIKQLNIPEKVTPAVFERMKAERNRKKVVIIEEGESEATRIKGDAESMRKELLAVAEAQAQLIRGEGEKKAAKYYEMLKEDPELAMFLRNLEALKKILAEKTTIVLGVETEPVDLLKGIPDIKPNQNAPETGN